ncbi:hypothetical protein ACNTOD_003980 [Vibrio navarrensis]
MSLLSKITLILLFSQTVISQANANSATANATGDIIWSKTTTEKQKFKYIDGLLWDETKWLYYESDKDREKICGSSSALKLDWRPFNYDEVIKLREKTIRNLDIAYRGGERNVRDWYSSYDDFLKQKYTCVHGGLKNFNDLFDVLFKYNLETSTKEPNHPVKTKVEIKKGEFEKTADFESRKMKAITDADISYESEMKVYQQKVSDRANKIASLERDYKFKMDVLTQAFHIYNGFPFLSDVSYDADNEYFVYTLNGLNYKNIIKQRVSIEYAEKFKDLITKNEFKPTVMVSITDTGFDISGIKELLSPKDAVIRSAYEDSFGSITKLESFISEYPDSSQAKEAKSQIDSLKQQEKERELAKRKAREAREKEIAAEQEAERLAYSSRKVVGDKVCKSGKVALGLIEVTITAFVERVEGNRIQIRISSTEGQSINYNDVPLTNGVLIWDQYTEWKHCP